MLKADVEQSESSSSLVVALAYVRSMRTLAVVVVGVDCKADDEYSCMWLLMLKIGKSEQ
jgi:hypothetical protein